MLASDAAGKKIETAESLTATLRFKGVPATIVVPWSAVYACITSTKVGVFWHTAAPESVRSSMRSRLLNTKLN
jgi:hypothetical protein